MGKVLANSNKWVLYFPSRELHSKFRVRLELEPYWLSILDQLSAIVILCLPAKEVQI